MNRTLLIVAVVMVLGALALGIGSCTTLKKIKGNVAGRVQTAEGRGMGYVSVALVDTETGSEEDRMTAEDSGSFMFREVDPSTYIIKVFTVQGDEIPSSCEEFTLGPGRTANIDVTLTGGGE